MPTCADTHIFKHTRTHVLIEWYNRISLPVLLSYVIISIDIFIYIYWHIQAYIVAFPLTYCTHLVHRVYRTSVGYIFW